MKQQTIGLTTLVLILALLIGCNQAPIDATPPVPPITPTISEGEATQSPLPTPTLKPTEAATETPIANPNAKSVLISHILAGVNGNNNFDYIALYNNTGSAVNLEGYKLEYQPRPDADIETIVEWNEFTPFVSDYYLLGREDETFSTVTDGTFTQQIFNRGSMMLIDPAGNQVDLVGWGDMPEGTYFGEPAPKLPRGSTLVRQLNPSHSSSSNADLFVVEAESQMPVCIGEESALSITAPESVAPGSEFEIAITLQPDTTISEIGFLIPAGFAIAQGEPVSEPTYIGLQPDQTETIITMTAPTTLQQSVLRGSRVVIDGQSFCVPPQIIAVEGRLPIGIARGLIDETVTIEGTATMFTDGFFAGSSGTKFYIEDETGGVQIYVPGGKGGVDIQLGDKVRVTGKTEYYRTSLEVIPADFEQNIEVIGAAEDESLAQVVDVNAAARDIALNGRLIAVTGGPSGSHGARLQSQGARVDHSGPGCSHRGPG
ncbi:MAG: lamin tail domain-containing protein, partial [Chloroflexota bacterium]